MLVKVQNTIIINAGQLPDDIRLYYTEETPTEYYVGIKPKYNKTVLYEMAYTYADVLEEEPREYSSFEDWLRIHHLEYEYKLIKLIPSNIDLYPNTLILLHVDY